MADSIPRSYLKEITDLLAAETLKVAFFTSALSGYTETAASSLYSALSGEVSASGTGYTTGGYTLASLTSATIGSTNAVGVTAAVVSLPSSSTITCRYLVVYNSTTSKIRAVKDLSYDRIVSNGSFTITWDATNGVIKVSA